MQPATLVSVEEYLSTSYRPDCDYVGGVLLERNVGEWNHSRIQAALAAFFFNREPQLGIRVFTEQRVQVSPTHYRIPDVCVVWERSPQSRSFARHRPCASKSSPRTTG